MHLPAEEQDGGDEEGGAEVSVNGPEQLQQQEKDVGGEEEEQQPGQSAASTSALSTSRWRSLHRHMHSALSHRSSQLVLSPSLGFGRSVRRTQSDATTLQHAAEEALAGRGTSAIWFAHCQVWRLLPRPACMAAGLLPGAAVGSSAWPSVPLC